MACEMGKALRQPYSIGRSERRFRVVVQAYSSSPGLMNGTVLEPKWKTENSVSLAVTEARNPRCQHSRKPLPSCRSHRIHPDRVFRLLSAATMGAERFAIAWARCQDCAIQTSSES